KSEKGDTVSFNGAVVGATPPAVPVKRQDGKVVVDLPAAVAVRLRDDADEVVRASLPGEEQIVWRLAGAEEMLETAGEVRAAAAEVAGLEVSVSKIAGEGDHGDRRARGGGEGTEPATHVTRGGAGGVRVHTARAYPPPL